MTIIERMCCIVEKMHDEENQNGRISLELMENAASDIDILGKELGLSPMQTVFLTAITRRYSSTSISGQALAASLGISFLEFLSYNKELEAMWKLGYIRIDKNREITLPQQVLNSLIDNKPLKPEPTTGLDALTL